LPIDPTGSSVRAASWVVERGESRRDSTPARLLPIKRASALCGSSRRLPIVARAPETAYVTE
jgi:hypothetical protein